MFNKVIISNEIGVINVYYYVLKSIMFGDFFIIFDKEWFWSLKNFIKGKNLC